MGICRITELNYSRSGRAILKGISFSVESGEYVAVIGPNGAGKTTLLKHLNRIIPAEEETMVQLNDKPLSNYTQKEIARLVAYVAQTPAHIPHFTVREFIMMGRYPYLGVFASPTSSDDTAVDTSMDVADVGQYAERDMATLSGGELQKVYIAAGLAQGGEMILLDEPATFLDPRHQHEIFTILKNINQEGKTVITVTHDINTAVLTATRVIAMRAGSIVYDGTTEELMENDVLERVYEQRFSFSTHPDSGHKIAVPELYR